MLCTEILFQLTTACTVNIIICIIYMTYSASCLKIKQLCYFSGNSIIFKELHTIYALAELGSTSVNGD